MDLLALPLRIASLMLKAWVRGSNKCAFMPFGIAPESGTHGA